MRMIEPRTLADRLVEVTDRRSPPALLHDRIAEVALLDAWADNMNDAQEIVEPHLQAIRTHLLRIRNEAESEGHTWHIELYGSEDEWVRGASFHDKSLDPSEQDMRARRADIDSVLTELRRLTSAEFELICTRVVALLGCRDSRTSPLRDDGGIDFYGQLALQGRLNTRLPLGGIDARTNVWLIGQAKHYPTRAIQTSVVRELVGSVELARTKGAIHEWVDLQLRPFDATVLLIFTTGWFSSGSLSLLAKTGVLSMSGRQLATFLCDVSFGFRGNPPVFDRATFQVDLLSYN
jgi:hypothetical protein